MPGDAAEASRKTKARHAPKKKSGNQIKSGSFGSIKGGRKWLPGFRRELPAY